MVRLDHKKCKQEMKEIEKGRDYWRGLFCPYIATNLQNRHECCAFGSYIMEMRAAGLIPQENWETPCLIDEARSCPLFNLRSEKGGFPQIDWPEEYKGKAFPLGALPIFEDATSSIAREMKKWRKEVRH